MSQHDWTAFEALRTSIAEVPPGRVQRARVLERMAQARARIESGGSFRMRQDARTVLVRTPAHFVDAWEAGYR